MFNDMKQQFEDGLQKAIENQVKISEVNVQFANDIAQRNSAYLTDLVKSSTEVAKDLGECKTPIQLIEKQTAFANELRTKTEAYVKSNVDALTALSETVASVTGGLWSIPSAPTAASRRKTKAAE